MTATLRLIGFRAHEWLADHFSFIQYPRPILIYETPFFSTDMPWWLRLVLIIFGVIVIALASIVIGAILLLVAAAIAA